MGVGILAKRVVLELGSSTNFVYSLNWGRGIFKNPPAPIKNALSLIEILAHGLQGVFLQSADLSL